MSDSELRDQLMTLLLAGHETTATGLAWTFDLLLHHPEAHRRLLAELEAGGTEYLDAVIEESLRIRPVVPITGRLLHQPATLGGYSLEPGTVVLVAIYMAHTNPETFAEPFAFRPERFLDEGPETYSWVPFGGGTRRCIGAAFAQMEMRIVLRTVLGAAQLEAADSQLERPVRRNLTISPRHGTRVIARPR
jgi:cytochrome P450